MTNAFTRGSSPGRAREEWERTGSFQKGHKKGRPSEGNAERLIARVSQCGSRGSLSSWDSRKWIGRHRRLLHVDRRVLPSGLHSRSHTTFGAGELARRRHAPAVPYSGWNKRAAAKRDRTLRRTTAG